MEKIKFREKLCYSTGEFGSNLISMLISFYLLTFLTDVVGISALAAGNVIFFSKFWDAINDPLCGALAARTKANKKIGKYKPWMLVSALPYLLSVIGLFCIPSDLSNAGKIVMLIAMYNLWGMSGTAYLVPFGALTTLMTKDLEERANLGVMREWGAKIGGLIISLGGSYIVMYFGGGELNGAGYSRCAIFLAVIAFFCLLAPVFGTKERYLDDTVEAVSFKDSINYLKGGGKHVVMIVLVNLITVATPVFISSFTVYFCMNYLNNAMAISPCMSASMLPPIASLLLLPFLLKKLSRRNILICANIILIVGGIMSLFARENLVWVLISFAVKGFASGFGGSISLSMISDTAYFCEKKSGINAPSALYSLYTFSMKVSQAAVTWLTSVILTIIHYDGLLESQSAETINGLYLANGWVGIVIGVIGIILPLFYTLDKELAKVRKT